MTRYLPPVRRFVFATVMLFSLWEPTPSAMSGSTSAPDPEVRAQSTGLTAQAVEAGTAHTCALSTSGGVWCWGAAGALGDGTTVRHTTPIRVSGLARGVQAIATGARHTCALTTNGGVKCWGWNGYGQLGNGTTTDSLTPVDVTGLSSGVASISAGDAHTCATLTTGAAKCWGDNRFGQLGDGTTTPQSTPTDVSGLASGVKSISAGDRYSCAVTQTGGAKCWGVNGTGALGDGTIETRLSPTDVSGLTTGVKAIDAGYAHTCVVTTAGGAKCWGYNYSGQLGDGTTNTRFVPVDVLGLGSGVASIETGVAHTCALTSAGAVSCWGDNEIGQLGDGRRDMHHHPTASIFSHLASGVHAITAGGDHNCAVLSDGSIRCWGANSNGQLGDGTTTNRSTPIDAIGLTSNVLALGAGHSQSCAISADNGPVCWGFNSNGGVGDGTDQDRFSPSLVNGLGIGVQELDPGNSYTCALTATGGVKCWGLNDRGQLGDGTKVSSFVPVDAIGLNTGVASVAAGSFHVCALTTSGAVKCWGNNAQGGLGDGTTTERLTPTNVSGLTSGVRAITAGNGHSCALTAAGGVKCWGDNSLGELGDGTYTARYTPVDVSGLTSGVTAIAASDSQHTCALTVSGGVKCWGDNRYGQLGNGTMGDSTSPIDVIGLTSGVRAISTGYSFSCALTTAGGVKCWGDNSENQLGDGTTTSRLTPTDVSGLDSGVQSIDVGVNHTCALTTAGGVKCWGNNAYGQLGVNPGWEPVAVIGFGPPIVPARFLDLPISYDGTRIAFSQVVQNWNAGGRINSWFDHSFPGVKDMGTLVLYTGQVIPPSAGRCDFGIYCYDDHNGLDFSGNEGSDIQAAASGQVVKVVTGCAVGDRSCGGGFGNFVVIYHAFPNMNGYFTLYGHLSEIKVAIGAVAKGQVIGAMGHTGNVFGSTGTHLHFGVYQDNGNGIWDGTPPDLPVDPFGFLPDPLDDPWVTKRQGPTSYPLWIYDTTTTASTGGQAVTLVGATQNVTAAVPANRFPGQATFELLTGPVAGPLAQLRQAGQTFWLTLIEWIQGLGATPNSFPADFMTASDPITLTVQYTEDQARHLDMSQAAIYRWDEATSVWQALPTTLDAQTRTLTGLAPDVGQFSPQAPLLCPTDTTEPDDALTLSTVLTLGGASASHVFDSPADEDWFMWDAQANVPYVLEARSLGDGVDPLVEIRSIDSQTELVAELNRVGSITQIELTFPNAGTYYTRVNPAPGSATGCASAYQLNLFVPRVYLPALTR